MTELREYRAWVRAATRLSSALQMMDGVPFLGIGPDIRAECKEIWDKMDDLKGKIESKIEEMEKEGKE